LASSSKSGEDAARAIGADFEYIYTPSADMADMASSIQAAAATQPDGMVVSLPDPDALDQLLKLLLLLVFQYYNDSGL